MSASLRKFRALVYEYHDAGAEGQVDSTYHVVSSGDEDERWWCSKTNPSGHETTTGMKAEHRVDAVFGFAAHVPINEHCAIECDGESFWVRAVLPRDYGRDEVQVFAERTTSLALTSS